MDVDAPQLPDQAAPPPPPPVAAAAAGGAMDIDTPQPKEQAPAAAAAAAGCVSQGEKPQQPEQASAAAAAAAAAANGRVPAGSSDVVSREQRALEFECVLNSAGRFLALHSKWRQQRCAEVAAKSARFK
jgi:hypothetical protein